MWRPETSPCHPAQSGLKYEVRWDWTFLIMPGPLDLNIKPGYWGDNHNGHHHHHQSLTSHQSPTTLELRVEAAGCLACELRDWVRLRGEGPEGGEGEELLKFSHYEIRQSEESRESLASGTQPASLSWYQANLCSIFRNMQFIFQDESKYSGWTRQGVTSCLYQIWVFLQLVALFGISGLFVRENKTSQPVDLQIKLGPAVYSVEIPLNPNMKHFQINKPSLASGISISARRPGDRETELK